MSDLRELSRADLVQVAKDEDVKASGRNEEIIERIVAKRAAAPASSSVDGTSVQSDAAPHPGDADGAEPITPPSAAQPVEAVEAEASDLEPAQPIVEDVPPTAGDELPICRETDAAWWCPICDNSQTHSLQECGGCGAARDGAVVIA